MGTPTALVFPLYESVTSALSAVGGTNPDRKDGHTASTSLPARETRERKENALPLHHHLALARNRSTRQADAQLGPHKEGSSQTGTEDSLPSVSQASALGKNADKSLASPKALPAGLEAAVINGSQEVF